MPMSYRGGRGSRKPTFADMGEGGVKKWGKIADVLNGRPLLLNKSYLNSGKPCNSGQFTADQTFHYIESTLYMKNSKQKLEGKHAPLKRYGSTLDIVESLVSHKLSTIARFSTIQIGFIK